jgi:hypothetical protein
LASRSRRGFGPWRDVVHWPDSLASIPSKGTSRLMTT